jgi:hypothetical protein
MLKTTRRKRFLLESFKQRSIEKELTLSRKNFFDETFSEFLDFRENLSRFLQKSKYSKLDIFLVLSNEGELKLTHLLLPPISVHLLIGKKNSLIINLLSVLRFKNGRLVCSLQCFVSYSVNVPFVIMSSNASYDGRSREKTCQRGFR